MKFSAIVDQAKELLQRKGRLTYGALKREFELDDEALADLRDELIEAEQVAVDENGRVLVWTGRKTEEEEGKRGNGNAEGKKGKWGNGEKDGVPGQWTPPHLAERIRAATVTDGERKTITALFADLKGSTALIEGLDPEEARAIIDPALQLMMDAVHRYEGYVAQALGDGIFALFGAPLAHEDHPQRALYAALRMQEEMRRYSDHVRLKGGPPLLMRVGINTGEVVVRSIRKDDLHTDYVPVGHSTNLAARMEQMATPGSILITEQTGKLAEGYFALKAMGAAQIKGIEEPLHVYEVVGAGPFRTKLQVASRRGLTRFVGRQRELEQLTRALEQARAGQGQIVGVMGEPGLGKSRLFYEFKLTSHTGCLVLEAYSVSYGKASPYLPLIELLKSYFDLTLEDEERKRREKVTGKVLTLDRNLEETLPYLFALLGINDPTVSLPQMDPQIQRRRTFEALKKLFLRESLNQPLILIFEDLHWIDSETQGFLDMLSESVASAKILLLTNYRPEYRHEWGTKTYYMQLRLAPFGKDEAEEFLDNLLGQYGFPLPGRENDRVSQADFHALKHLILDKTEGTPFFMEEVVQTLTEEGVLTGERGHYQLTQRAPTLHLPTTVQGVPAARIDRLAPDEKALLQQLAVIGREFPLSLIRGVVTQPEEEMYRLLTSLQHKEFLYEQPALPEVEYFFKHALTQEVAYGTVLQERRKALHEKTARAIEALYHTTLDDHYSELAHHYTRSGNTEKAIDYLHLAGQQAVQRSAYSEAVKHFTQSIALLQTLPDTEARTRREILAQTLLGSFLMVTKGIPAPEVGVALARAYELCQLLADPVQTFSVLVGLRVHVGVRGEARQALAYAEQLLHVAQRVGESGLRLQAHMALGVSYASLGQFALAHHHCEQGIRLYDPHQHRSHAFLYGYDPKVLCLLYASWVLWLLGYPDQARGKNQELLTFVRDLASPYSLVHALIFGNQLHVFLREEQTIIHSLPEAIRLCTEYGISVYPALSAIFEGRVMLRQGRAEEGMRQIQQALASLETMEVRIYQPEWLAYQAEGYAELGQVERGLAVLTQALALVEKNDERLYEAELHRLKGALTLQQTKQKPTGERGPRTLTFELQTEAEAYFHKAIAVAQKQQAKSLELRAAMSLSRLWQQQGKKAEAHKLLSEVYNWFTEGFDTKDLQEAKALLEEVSQ